MHLRRVWCIRWVAYHQIGACERSGANMYGSQDLSRYVCVCVCVLFSFATNPSLSHGLLSAASFRPSFQSLSTVRFYRVACPVFTWRIGDGAWDSSHSGVYISFHGYFFSIIKVSEAYGFEFLTSSSLYVACDVYVQVAKASKGPNNFSTMLLSLEGLITLEREVTQRD